MKSIVGMTVGAVVGIGLLAGMVGGLVGVGGGIVTVPLMILALDVAPKTAVGTSLAVIIPTSLMATWRHHQLGHVDWKLVAIMAAGSVIGAFVGASLTAYISGEWLRKSFAVFLMIASIRLLLK